MKTHSRTLSHYFYSWIQRTTSFWSLVFFKLISGISLACWTLWICAGQCFHAYIMSVCVYERVWERKVMKEGPAAGEILVLAVRRADDGTTGGFEFVFCFFFVCMTQILFTHIGRFLAKYTYQWRRRKRRGWGGALQKSEGGKMSCFKKKIKVNKLRNIWRRETELNLRWWEEEKKRERKFPIKLKLKFFCPHSSQIHFC